MNRRNFIQSGALLSGGLLISFTIPKANKLAALADMADLNVFAPNAFLNIGTDNSISVYLSHVEMGQGIWTTLPMLIADELDVDLKKINIKHGGADKAFNHVIYGAQITGGQVPPGLSLTGIGMPEQPRGRSCFKQPLPVRGLLSKAAKRKMGLLLPGVKDTLMES
ncbi:molybdopterin cofactor-binding domain-containing protein [Mucilaginibacter sp. UC70_90]